MMKSDENLRRANPDDDYVREKSITEKVDAVVQSKIPIQLEEIFNDIDEGDQKKVLMEGAPGSGKSTLSLHICQQWAQEKTFKDYILVILVRLRDLIVHSAQSIADLLPRKSDTIAQDIATEISARNGSGVLFVLDGWDELPNNVPGYKIILDFIEGMQLNESSIIITSRPTSSTILQPLVCTRIEILGFSRDEVQHFFHDCLNKNTKAVESLLQRVKVNPVIEGSCYLPLNASILVHLFKCGNNVLPTTQYGIFSALVLNCILRDLKKTTPELEIRELSSLDSLPPEIDGPFQHLCEIAYKGVEDDKVIFNLSPNIRTLGLLQGVESIAHCGRTHSYNFLHLTVQELLAGHHIATKLEGNDQVARFKKLFDKPRFSAVFQFYAAITKLKTKGINEVVMQVAQKCEGEYSKSEDKARLLSLLHCLFEAQDSTLYDLVAQQLKSGLDIGNSSLSTADCFAIGYLTTFTKNFNLHLYNCSIDADGCKALFEEGKVYSLRILK